MKKFMIAALALVVTGASAFAMPDPAAANPHHGINQRQAHQQRRILQGVRSGSLTPRETYRLERKQARIQALESRFRSNGSLSRRERRVLQSRLNHSNRAIYRLKHNRHHF